MKILLAGDYCPQGRIADYLNGSKELKHKIFGSIKDYINSADYSILNFECCVVNVSQAKPINKFGPCLKCSANSIPFLAEEGFDCVTLANNHFRDFGDSACNNTIKLIKSSGLNYVGGGANLKEAQEIKYVTINEEKVAFINACEHEFSIATDDRAGSAPLDVVDICNQIKEARDNAKYVIVIIHGGHEHYQLPSPRMVKTYRFFVDNGADAIINHHQHCFSGYEVYKNKPIFYGLGNFLFDWKGKRNSAWNSGYIVLLNMNESVDFEIVPYTQCNEEPVIELMSAKNKETFNDFLSKLNLILADSELLNQRFQQYCQERSRAIICPFTPYINKYARLAAGRHFLPYLIPIQKMAAQINYIECESHRDVLLNIFHGFINK